MRLLLSVSRPLLFAFCSLLVTSTAHAEMLLATIVMPGHYFDPGVVLPGGMGFGVYPLSGPGTGFGRFYNETDVGTVYEAPTALMAGFNAGFDDPDAEIIMSTMSDVGNWDLSQFWRFETRIFPHVPQLGVGLQGYDISRITQTVDSLVWGMSGRYLVANGQQTVRLYGHVEVPEPATPVLIAALLVICVRRHCSPSRLRAKSTRLESA